MKSVNQKSFDIGEWHVDPATDRISRGGEVHSLRPKTMDVLVYLAERQGEVASADELIEVLWPGVIVSDASVYACINQLREALGDDKNAPHYIETIPKRGYRLTVPVIFDGEVAVTDSGEAGRTVNYRLMGMAIVFFMAVIAAVYVFSPGKVTTDSTEIVGAEQLPGDTAEDSYPPVVMDQPSLAVLPFNNMSNDPEQEYLADGLTEDLITKLAQQDYLFVIARNSSFSYKGQSLDIRQVGRELGVQYVVEGSIRKIGDQVRVNAQLTEAATGKHHWAETYDRPWEEFFEIESELAEGLAAALGTELFRAEVERATKANANTLNAWELYHRAFSKLGVNYSAAGLAERITLLRRALALEPDSALAARIHGLFSIFHSDRVEVGWSKDPASDEAEAWLHGRRARELAPNDPRVLAQWGLLHNVFGNPQEAVRILRYALELHPTGLALFFMPQALVRAGQPDEAIKYIEKGARLDPKSPYRWVRNVFLSFAHIQLQQYDEAEAAARQATWEAGSTRFPWGNLAIVLAAQGKPEEARVAMAKARAIEPDYTLAKLEQFYLRFFPDEQQAVQVMAWARQAWGDE